MIARAWVKKLSYYQRLWVDSGSLEQGVSEAEHGGVVEEEAWLDWAFALPNDEPTSGNVLGFRAWRPML
eukprot:5245824-Pyramimonas_sp.AAC.1